MNKIELLKHFPFLDKCKKITADETYEFENDKKTLNTYFTLPAFLRDCDWLPKWKREMNDTKIASILAEEKQPMYYWSLGNEIVIFYYDKKNELYYEILYEILYAKNKTDISISAIVVMKSKELVV